VTTRRPGGERRLLRGPPTSWNSRAPDTSDFPLTAQFKHWLSASLFGALASLASSAPVGDGLPEWRNAGGMLFRAHPVEALGPYALFGAEAKTNRLLKFRSLTAEDCVRFHLAVAPRPTRAVRWTEAQGLLTRELLGRVRAVAEWNRATDDLTALPEPELLLIYFHTSNAPPTEAAAQDAILRSFEPFARRVRRIYPGRVEVVVAVARPGVTGAPSPSTVWMTANPERLAEIGLLRGFMPAVTSGLLLTTREGVPIAGGAVRDVFTLARILDHASALLWDLNPENLRTLPDRAHYRRAVRPTQFSEGAAPPEMLANPLRVEMLRRHGIARVDARIELDATGRVTAVTLRSTSEFTAALAETLRDTIRGSDVFVPAIQDGKPVAGSLDYSFVVPPPPDPALAAETAWVQGEARIREPIASWLVLRPIRVVDRVFTSVNRVQSDGTVILNSVTAGTAQLDSFTNDWFDRAGGAASVQPVEGQEQEIDGEKLVWQRISPVHDFVDLARAVGDSDNCVGYAWTEIVSSADTDAWLGIGSDDGLKFWVNGRLVADSWVVRPSRLDDDVVPFRLKTGRNQILVKVQNETAEWSFIARLRVREQ
jgi:hypothetical protein